MKIEEKEAVREWIDERFQLTWERLNEIKSDNRADALYNDYFYKMASFMVATESLYETRKNGSLFELSLGELEAINLKLYEDILPENYEESYANPAYAVEKFGKELGQLLSFLVTEIRGIIPLTFQGRIADMTVINELFIEVYNRFEQRVPEAEEIQQIIYWYVSDYSDQTVRRRIRERMDASLTFYKNIIMNADKDNLAYLYQYGEYISDNERKIAAYLGRLDESVIDGMAATFVDGYIRGFEVYKIDLTGKKNVQLRANIGFERVLRSVIRQFKEKGLDVAVFPAAIHSINKTPSKIGLISCSPNEQYEYDHRMDKGLYLDKALCERIVGVTKAAYEEYKDLADIYAGPALMEVFGETPFEPVAKDENVYLTEKQQKLALRLAGQMADIANQYIDAASISYAIIAWPLPSIGDDFEAIMDATVEVNNLDNDIFRKIQQTMIDAMDGADHMYIRGMNGNQTDLKVALWQLKHPEAETVFENCCADVNIPVGEVFTSPVLTGTNGILNVSNVYLNGLNYRNLTLEFVDGCVASYDCANYEDEAKNQAYIKQNLLQNHETLPMGEFAIGTNTTAYAMERKFEIANLMPILIMEKTGPHFAIGDTCYSHSEDHKVYNQDGKEIVARENEKSCLRNTDSEAAYFNVHTDITIPYDEIGQITACFADGRQVDIIKNGRFCLEGTEMLNDAIDSVE